MRYHTVFAKVAAIAFIAALPAVASAQSANKAQIELMFVQNAEDLKVDAKAGTIRLIDVAQQALYFSDRPERLAGHLKMKEYLQEWTSKAGADNFGKNPPNATLSVYEGDNSQSTLVVVELLDPKIEGKDIVYHYKLIEGEMPKSGGETALFIDWIGPGGGVGRGFHGVGVGRRGPGVTGWAGVAARNTACAASADCY